MIKSCAVLTIKGASTMTANGRKNIARWLDRQKEFFLKYSEELSPTFRARYLYDDERDVILTDEPPRKPK